MTTEWLTIEDYDAAYRKLARDKEAQITELRARVRELESNGNMRYDFATRTRQRDEARADLAEAEARIEELEGT